jgi:hypothetical protein
MPALAGMPSRAHQCPGDFVLGGRKPWEDRQDIALFWVHLSGRGMQVRVVQGKPHSLMSLHNLNVLSSRLEDALKDSSVADDPRF